MSGATHREGHPFCLCPDCRDRRLRESDMRFDLRLAESRAQRYPDIKAACRYFAELAKAGSLTSEHRARFNVLADAAVKIQSERRTEALRAELAARALPTEAERCEQERRNAYGSTGSLGS